MIDMGTPGAKELNDRYMIGVHVGGISAGPAST